MAKSPRTPRSATYRDSHGIDGDYKPGRTKVSHVKKAKILRKTTPKIILKLRLRANTKATLLEAQETKKTFEGGGSMPPPPNLLVDPIVKTDFDSINLHPMDYGPAEQPETEPFPAIDVDNGQQYPEDHCFIHCTYRQCVRIAYFQQILDSNRGIHSNRPKCACNRRRAGTNEDGKRNEKPTVHEWTQIAEDEIIIVNDEAFEIIDDVRQTNFFPKWAQLRELDKFSCSAEPAQTARNHCFDELETFIKRSTSGAKHTSFIDTPKNLKLRLMACLGLRLSEYIDRCTPLSAWQNIDETFSVTAGLASEMVLRYPLAKLVWDGWMGILDDIVDRLNQAHKLRVIEAALKEAMGIWNGMTRKVDEMDGLAHEATPVAKRLKRAAKAPGGLRKSR